MRETHFFNLLKFSIADYVPILYNMIDSTICNVHTQSEFTYIPAEFAMQKLEGNALKHFCFGILASYKFNK